GAYAHSFGLEGLVDSGVVHDRETLRRYLLHAVLPSLRNLELPLSAHAWRAFHQGPDWEKVEEISELSHALKPARELRAASENIGRQRAELAAALHGDLVAETYLARSADGGWPFSTAVSAALEAKVHGAPMDAMLAGIVYSTLAAQLAA